MELKEQAPVQTLAQKLGDVPHVSGLLRCVKRQGRVGDEVADWLLKVAVERAVVLPLIEPEMNGVLPSDTEHIGAQLGKVFLEILNAPF